MTLRGTVLTLCLLAISACGALNAEKICSPSMNGAKTIMYTVTTDGTADESSALVAAIGDDGAKQTIIQLNDTGDYDASIRMVITGDLTAGATFSYDPSLSMPDDYVWPLKISGLGPDGSEGGLYYGGLTITAASEAGLSGNIDLTYYVAEAAPAEITAAFADLPIQACS